MEIDKLVAKKELSFIGGQPKVREFWNNLNNKKIDVLKCADTPQKGVQSCATIGLNAVDIGLVSDGKSLRVEVVGASNVLIECFENIVASVAFDVMDSKQCFPGYIVKDVIEQYIPNCKMKHIMLTDPFLWDDANCMEIGEIYVAWLMMVPISEEEYKYACKNGIEALETLFEEKDIDIYNLHRESVIG